MHKFFLKSLFTLHLDIREWTGVFNDDSVHSTSPWCTSWEDSEWAISPLSIMKSTVSGATNKFRVLVEKRFSEGKTFQSISPIFKTILRSDQAKLVSKHEAKLRQPLCGAFICTAG